MRGVAGTVYQTCNTFALLSLQILCRSRLRAAGGVVLATAADIGVVVIGTGITAVLTWAMRRVWQPVADRRAAERLASSLGAGVQLDYFVERLGPASFRRRVGANFDHSFIRPLFYVQAMTDAQNEVIFFTITTRSKHFAPRLGFSGGSPALSVHLGRSHFAAVAPAPNDYRVNVGIRQFQYWEDHYFGNPGRYQSFILGFSDSGYLGSSRRRVRESGGHLLAKLQFSPLSDDERQSVCEQLREFTIVNTYGETAPHVKLRDHFGTVGIDKDQVRVLD